MAKARPIHKVLVIARGPIGPFVLSLAALRRIREAHADAHVTLLTTPEFEGLSRACPDVDAVDIDGAPDGFGEWMQMVGFLRRARFDRVYDLDNSPWTHRLFRWMWPAPAWSGTVAGCSLPYRNRGAMHPLERQADQLRAAGIWPEAPTTPFAAPPPDAEWIGRRVLQPRGQPRPHVMLVPGAMSDPPESRWPAASFADVALRLRKQGYDVLVVGGPEDAPIAHAIQHRAQVRDMTGRPDFAHLGALAARASLAIGNDTGLMHLIAAAGAPTLSLFSGRGDPALTGPRGHVAVLQADSLANLPPTEVMRAIQRLTPLNQRTV